MARDGRQAAMLDNFMGKHAFFSVLGQPIRAMLVKILYGFALTSKTCGLCMLIVALCITSCQRSAPDDAVQPVAASQAVKVSAADGSQELEARLTATENRISKLEELVMTQGKVLNDSIVEHSRQAVKKVAEHKKTTDAVLLEHKKGLGVQIKSCQKDVNDKLNAHVAAVDQKVNLVENKVMKRLEKTDEKFASVQTKVTALQDNAARSEAVRGGEPVDKKIQKVVNEQFGMLREEMAQRVKDKAREEKRKEVLDRLFDRLVDAEKD